jgi:hypothetical protein
LSLLIHDYLSKIISPVYMPIEQEKRKIVPATWAGMDIADVPVEGRSFSTPRVGITNDLEHA